MLFKLDGLARLADFISVGSNDLLQFMTASDRGNILVATRFDPLSRPFLRALRSISRAAATAHVPVTLCGELAGNPLAAMALVGLGYRSLSMTAAAIGLRGQGDGACPRCRRTARRLLEALLDDGETVERPVRVDARPLCRDAMASPV